MGNESLRELHENRNVVETGTRGNKPAFTKRTEGEAGIKGKKPFKIIRGYHKTATNIVTISMPS